MGPLGHRVRMSHGARLVHCLVEPTQLSRNSLMSSEVKQGIHRGACPEELEGIANVVKVTLAAHQRPVHDAER